MKLAPQDWKGQLPDSHDPTLVGQREWCVHIPALHRVLAHPDGRLPIPRYRPGFSLSEACAFWEPAVYLLHFLLGWRDPGKGLQWWYSNGLDSDGDERLQLLEKVWNDQGQLDLLAAWFWTQGDSGHRGVLAKVSESWDFPPARPLEEFRGRSWAQDFQSRYGEWDPEMGFDPYHGGTNPLHLGHSAAGCGDQRDEPLVLHTDTETRRAVVVLNRATGWYETLAAVGARLPSVGTRSWHVDVFVRPLGWLGTFRRSRESLLWFQGRHSLHMRGQ